MTNDIGDESELDFRRMTSGDRQDAFALFSQLLEDDPYYRDSSAAYSGAQSEKLAAERALAEGLAFYIDRPDYGFVWMAFDDGRPVAGATIGYAISLSLGKLVAKLEYLIVTPEARRSGAGAAFFETLVAEIRSAECARIDTVVHIQDDAVTGFYRSLGFVPSNEQRMSLLLES